MAKLILSLIPRLDIQIIEVDKWQCKFNSFVVCSLFCAHVPTYILCCKFLYNSNYFFLFQKLKDVSSVQSFIWWEVPLLIWEVATAYLVNIENKANQSS